MNPAWFGLCFTLLASAGVGCHIFAAQERDRQRQLARRLARSHR